MSELEWRQNFADFLSRLAADFDHEGEWLRLVVTHYRDEELEGIRRNLARLSIERSPTGAVYAWQPEDRIQMVRWVEQLRRDTAESPNREDI
jgi:hypothetical protein